jgi:hypothetical protein
VGTCGTPLLCSFQMCVARPFQGRVAGLKAPRYINMENALEAKR